MYTLCIRRGKGIFSPCALYSISEHAERISVRFNIGMYNKIRTSTGYFLYSGAYLSYFVSMPYSNAAINSSISFL